MALDARRASAAGRRESSHRGGRLTGKSLYVKDAFASQRSISQDDTFEAIFAKLGKDDDQEVLHGCNNCVTRLLQKPWCGHFINGCILVNSLMVSIEQSCRLAGEDTLVFLVLENIFLCVFVTELLVRVMAQGRHVVQDTWFWFDATLVAIAVAANWVVPLTSASNTEALSAPLVMRIARLARLARAVRLVHSLGQLWLLVHAFLTSARTVLYVMVVVVSVLYMFNAMAVELVTFRYQGRTDVPLEVQDVVSEHFSSVTTSFLTLVQFVCLDSISPIYRPLVMYDWTLAIFFLALILVVGIVLTNIITAVIVDAAFQVSSEDAELRGLEEMRKKEKMLADLYEMFVKCDKDKSGNLTLDELVHCGQAEAQILKDILGDIEPEEAFNMLDADDSGVVGIGEFCDGLYEARVCNHQVEVRRLSLHVKELHRIIQKSTLEVHRVLDVVAPLLRDAAAIRDAGASDAECKGVDHFESDPDVFSGPSLHGPHRFKYATAKHDDSCSTSQKVRRLKNVTKKDRGNLGRVDGGAGADGLTSRVVAQRTRSSAVSRCLEECEDRLDEEFEEVPVLRNSIGTSSHKLAVLRACAGGSTFRPVPPAISEPAAGALENGPDDQLKMTQENGNGSSEEHVEQRSAALASHMGRHKQLIDKLVADVEQQAKGEGQRESLRESRESYLEW